MNIINKIKNNYYILIVVALAILFFIGVSSYNFYSQSDDFVKWGSPDETANYIFAKLYAQEGDLTIAENYNLYTNNIMHPRSFMSDAGLLKPVSFLGIIIFYGKLASFTSYKIIPYLTPLIAAIGIIYFYLFIKRLYGKNNALVSTILLTFFPVYVYYSARSMFHNVLLMALLIISLYYTILITREKSSKYIQWIYSGLGGIFLGLAVAARTSEIFWILPLFLILWLFNIKKVGALKLFIFLSFLIIALMPSMYWNQILYGNYFYTGYPEMNQSLNNIASAGAGIFTSAIGSSESNIKDLFLKLKDNIFYFGFHPRESVKNFFYYFTDMFYWLFWPALLGFIVFTYKIKKWEYKHWIYLISYITISLLLIFYYGSWKFYDNPDTTQVTIGNSYTRYWLPIYLGALPYVSLLILKLTRLFKKNILIITSRAIILAIIILVSLYFVLIGSDEGLIYTYKKQTEVREEYNKVLSLTESNSAIITQYHDKLFFPERKVIVGLFTDEKINKQYANLVDYLPVYYYNFTLPEKDINYLNNKRLKEVDLRIEEVERVAGDFTLYRLINF